jgi:hypothetical protein
LLTFLFGVAFFEAVFVLAFFGFNAAVLDDAAGTPIFNWSSFLVCWTSRLANRRADTGGRAGFWYWRGADTAAMRRVWGTRIATAAVRPVRINSRLKNDFGSWSKENLGRRECQH